MIDFLVECALFLLRKLKIKLTDCPQLFTDMVEGRRTRSAPSRVFVWLCQILGVASALRVGAITLFVLLISLLLWHFEPRWPFFAFDDPVREDSHYIYWGLRAIDAKSPIHYCEVLALMSTTTFIVMVLCFMALAWISDVMVREFFPLNGSANEQVPVQLQGE
jgi:hypothetical protein